MGTSHQTKIDDSYLFLGVLNKEKSLLILQEKIKYQISYLKLQSEPIIELPKRLSEVGLFRFRILRSIVIKLWNFMSRENRKNAKMLAESLELMIEYIDTKTDEQ